MKKTVGLVLTLVFLTMTFTANLSERVAGATIEISVYVNDKGVEFAGDKPFVDGNNNIMLPVEPLSKFLGYSVEKRDGGKVVELTRNEPYTKITIEVGKYSAIFETSTQTQEVAFGIAAQSQGDSTYFSAKYVSKLLNYSLQWDSLRRQVSIDTHRAPVDAKDKETPPVQDNSVPTNQAIDPKSISQRWMDVPYASVSPTQALNIFLPNEGEGPFPVIIMIHGGAFVSGDKKYVDLHGVDKGYAVVSVGYRLSQEAKFPAQINDIKAAIRFLRANATKYNLDPDKFAVWGSSSGGMLAALAGTSGGVKELQDDTLGNAEQSDRVQAVVDMCGGVNTENEALFKSTPGTAEFKNEVQFAWAETYITPDDSPFLIVHGTEDKTIPIDHSANFYQKLTAVLGESNVVFDVVEGAGHEYPLVGAVDPVEFLDIHLKGTSMPSEPVNSSDNGAPPALVIVLTLGSQSIMVNGEGRTTDVAPQAVNGRTLVPLRFIAETMGAEVDWIEEHRTAVVVLDGVRVELPIGYVNPTIGLDVPAQLLNGRTLVPLRYISETLGATVDWREATNSVELIRK